MIRHYFFLLALTAEAQTGNVLLNDGKLPSKERVQVTDIRPGDVVHWTPSGGSLYGNGFISLTVRLSTEREFRIYADKLKFFSPTGHFIRAVKKPKTESVTDPMTGEPTEVHSQGEFDILLQIDRAWTQPQYQIGVEFLGCSARICLFPYQEIITVPVYQTPGNFDLAAFQNSHPQIINPELSALIPARAKSQSLEESLLRQLSDRASVPLWLFMLIALLGGILTNLTPCVYPMIPITIRILGKQGRHPYLSGVVYALGIMTTYTGLGVFAALTGGLFGKFMGSTWFNVLVSAFMAIFAFSMLGIGNFSVLQRLGQKLALKKKNLSNSYLMGLGAGFVASPCTGPILASLLTYTASLPDKAHGVFVLFVYSLGFAAPYALLGGLSAKLSQVKVSDKVQILTKLVFSGLMFALCFYYLRIPLQPLYQSLPWFPVFSSALGFALVAGTVYMFANRSIWPVKGLSFLASAALGLGLFAWTQWYVLSKVHLERDVLEWIDKEPQAYEKAKAENAPILIDFWAEWCEACKTLEAQVLNSPDVMEELKKNWVLLRYDLTENNDISEAIQARYKITGLPSLVVIPPKAYEDPNRFEILTGVISKETLLEALRLHGIPAP